jgi:hypothetical protein
MLRKHNVSLFGLIHINNTTQSINISAMTLLQLVHNMAENHKFIDIPRPVTLFFLCPFHMPRNCLPAHNEPTETSSDMHIHIKYSLQNCQSVMLF